ncbi:hypothetical protein F4777DRAFT_136998 [Nemania sp. FL0916]|nr:hypothetical protein F4777DRAFT_136998 [Nemania sp. FL0916]
MPDHRGPSPAARDNNNDEQTAFIQGRLLLRSRSPQLYHRQTSELLEASGSYTVRQAPLPTDSGTEADDEHFLKGLPAPRRIHKGLRGRNEVSSGTSTPFAPPAYPDEGGRRVSPDAKKDSARVQTSAGVLERRRRKRATEITRRCTELLIIGVLGLFVCTNTQVRPALRGASHELAYAGIVVAVLILMYPVRLLLWAYWHGNPSRRFPITIPLSFDPAPLFYPPTMTLLVASLIATDNPAVLLPNIVLALCSLPRALVPTLSPTGEDINPLHWVFASVPLFVPRVGSGLSTASTDYEGGGALSTVLLPEAAILLYPLHCSLVRILHSLTTTSLLAAELQLLSTGLINILLLSASPQITILRAMLWVGGLDILVFCCKPIQWGVSLARIPKWRFKRPTSTTKPESAFISILIRWRRMRHDLFHTSLDCSSCSSCETIDESDNADDPSAKIPKGLSRVRSSQEDDASPIQDRDVSSFSSVDGPRERRAQLTKLHRHTVPAIGRRRNLQTHTPSGRKKRSASISVKNFVSLTYRQAVIRKWIYAVYIYLCIVSAIFVPLPIIGIKDMVMRTSFHGDEPVGWAIGYLFGDIQWLRWQIVSRNLGWWICLPPRPPQGMLQSASHGWAERVRSSFGEANTRLILSAYFLITIAAGLIIVFRLSPICEVDTRRKVFHFMMVFMFLPATYIDPCFVALALTIVLAAFLLLDLLRASQLPPLSKPLAFFLAPYIDGRDLRGPIVISHIFLLIGCAIPLWLSLGSLPRTGQGHLMGWGVPTREVAMISGIVCVGLGDAAASLIGRRYGHRKWLWGGRKSLEGSTAFAAAVFLGLMAAQLWLRQGGWVATTRDIDPWRTTMQKTGICASMASLTEAVLTGGNDNVIVPVILWTCVKSLGV